MRHKLAKGKLSRPTQHRLLMLKGATMDLLKYESIETTESKAREIKKMDMKIRILVLETLWEIVLSDDKSGIYESNLIRRICGLLYISDKISGEIKLSIIEKNK